jgi:hypothetical protein
MVNVRKHLFICALFYCSVFSHKLPKKKIVKAKTSIFLPGRIPPGDFEYIGENKF